jgi:GNAT superfamily N-acetyltransferase
MVTKMAIDPVLLSRWVYGRSLARGLPQPVSDRNGLRVDTNSAVEVCRWIFPRALPELFQLAREVSRPGYLLKVCEPAHDLRAALPKCWQVEHTGYFMVATDSWESREISAGYTIDVQRSDPVTQVRIRASDGELAASGFAAETPDAFVYDRIVTAPAHRRKGLGRAVMTTLRETRRNPDLPGLLVATEDGRALYRTLGWQTLSLYSTASVSIM